jgi:uncharacterized membrane protein required for colicin V production
LALPLTAALLLTLSLAAALTIASTLAPATTTAAVRWLPERVNLPLDEVAVVFAIGVITAQLQRRLVCLDRIGPFLDRLLRSGFFELLTRAIQCIAEVVVRILLI